MGMPNINIGRKVNATGQSAEAKVAQIEAGKAAQKRNAALKEYNRQMDSAMRTQAVPEAAPAAQVITDPAEDERRRRMGGNRGSLLAGNTGGYNPATGGGRLGGLMRSILG